jgi:alpha-glucosidase (family GH31 glycosyl hydrolase)
MLSSQLFDLLKDAVMQGGECILKDTRLTESEAAFLNYYYIRFDNPQLSREYITETAKYIKSSHASFHKAAFWLWVLGEYINRTADTDFLKKQIEAVKTACSMIEGCWHTDLPHWLLPGQKGRFISNISIAYGAIQSISNSLKSQAQKLIVEIKRTAFKEFMDEGRIVSEKGSGIKGDLSIISVPFALLDAGNQIMVESINALERELVKGKISYSRDSDVRDDLTLLLSWYYTERGELGRARELLYSVMNSWEDRGSVCTDGTGSYFSFILYAIAKRGMESKVFPGNPAENIIFKHIPCGFENPYRKENYERLPNHPEEGDEVVLNLVVEPIDNNKAVYAVYRVGPREYKKEMKLSDGGGAGGHYTVSIGAFDYMDTICYRFTAGEKEEGESETYSFAVRKWLGTGALRGALQEEHSIIMQFEGLKGSSKYINLRIRNDTGKAMKLEIYQSSESLQVFGKGKYRLFFEAFELEADAGGSYIYINGLEGKRLMEIDLDGFIEMLCDGEGIIHKLRYNFSMDEHERFFGMGERYSSIQFKGQTLDCYVYNQYRDQGLRTYMPMPFTISSRGFGIYLDTSLYSVFKFGTKVGNLLQIEAELKDTEDEATLYLFFGPPKEVTAGFSQLTGRPSMVPKWSLGPWMSSNNWDSQREVISQAGLTDKYGIPATALVIEQWSDEATFYIFNDAQYDVKDGRNPLSYNDFIFEEWGRWPDPKAMVDYLHEKGIRVLLWQAPVMKYMDGISHGQRDEDERTMLSMGYHVRKADGSPYRVPYYEWFKGSLIPDFTNKDAAAWWLKKREYLLTEIGIDGFKTDGGECIYGSDTVFHDGSTGGEMRNLYPNLYIKTFYDYANSQVEGGTVTFSRAGFTGAQAIPMHWAGDERSTFEAFRASIRAGLSSGMSGIIFWGWDIGGFNGEIPSAELYIRSSQMAAFCPVMQYHAETRGEYNRDRTPWNIAERRNCPEVIDIFRKYANLRMNLLPYLYNEASICVTSGVPMMRSMFLEYPSDMECIDDTSQYFLGSDLLCAPVIYEGDRGRDVYLPEGSWSELITGVERCGGKTLFVNAALEDMPVFIREDSIIPLNLDESLELCRSVGNNLREYKNMVFLVYVRNRKCLEFTDDLGNNIFICAAREYDMVKITLQGSLKDNMSFIIRSTDEIKRVTVNDREYSGIPRGNEIIIARISPAALDKA